MVIHLWMSMLLFEKHLEMIHLLNQQYGRHCKSEKCSREGTHMLDQTAPGNKGPSPKNCS